jgi:hypothetical protein
MGLQPSYSKGPHPLLLASLWAARVKMAVSGIRNCLNYYEIFRRVCKIVKLCLSVCLFVYLSIGPYGTTNFLLNGLFMKFDT